MITLHHYLSLSFVLFVIGICGVIFNKRTIINSLIALEIMLLSVNINFASFARYSGDLGGNVFVLFVFLVAAAEVALGLGGLIIYFKNKGDISIKNMSEET